MLLKYCANLTMPVDVVFGLKSYTSCILKPPPSCGTADACPKKVFKLYEGFCNLL